MVGLWGCNPILSRKASVFIKPHKYLRLNSVISLHLNNSSFSGETVVCKSDYNENAILNKVLETERGFILLSRRVKGCFHNVPLS